jgi:hypothetical protein
VLTGLAVGLVPGVVISSIFIVWSILHIACLEELALDVADSAGLLLGLGAMPTALLARALQGLRPRRGLALACKGLGWANIAAAGTSAAGLLYAWHDGDLRAAVPLSVTVVMTIMLGVWLTGGTGSAPGAPPPTNRRRWAWIVGSCALLMLAGIAFWVAERKVSVPPFDVEVQLTEQARKKLDAAGETIIVAIDFDGDGRRRPGEHTAPFRAVFLGSHEVELRHAGRVRIGDARISREAIGRLSDPNYHFFINVYSGRRVFKDNVLNGGYADGRASDLNPAKPVVVRCGLL